MKTIWMILLGISAYGYEIVIEKTAREFQRDDAKEVVIDTKNKLMWQDDESVKTTEKDWSGAISYCDNLSFAGFSDWRLPKRMELHSISDKTKYNPAIKDGFKNVASGYYWSSSLLVSNSSDAWVVYFHDGDDGYRDKFDNRLVRCVRDSN